jgi:hypothetical protein
MKEAYQMPHETLAPVLRIQNADVSAKWYQRLGFDVDYEHGSGPGFSRTFAVLKRGDLVLLLSNGTDAPNSTAVLHLRVANIEPLAREFDVPIENLQGGALIGRKIDLQDPDGNRIRVADFTPAPKPAFPM